MDKILNQINQSNLEILCVLVAIVAILLAIIVIGDYLINKVKYSSKKVVVVKETPKPAPVVIEEEKLSKTTPIKEIKYVHENDEIEKAKAQLQLQALKQELMEKEKLILKEQEEIKRKAEELKVVPVVDKPLPILDEPVKEIERVTITLEEEQNEVVPIKIIDELNIKELEEKPSKVENLIQSLYNDEEESAIISIAELKEASVNAYSDEQMAKYDDEGNEPISLQEVEMLANTMKLKPIELREFELTSEPVAPISEPQKTSFANTPNISPIFGTTNKVENRITIEQTANYDKLNEEIKKTNEFLVTLKELRKNLD